MNKTRWRQLMTYFKISNDFKMYENITRAYTEPHRHYHTLEHINQMLNLFDLTKSTARKTEELELAIIFHDLVYEIPSTQNELMSAKITMKFLQNCGVQESVIDRIFKLILSTRHDIELHDHDQQLLSDIDLSILGQESNIFEDYESKIRKEFQYIPKDIYIKGRIKVLNHFLQKSQIYHTEYFAQNYEHRSRINIKNSIHKLKLHL
jgi:predicted metal-dependent HD superfamily phosphohydrolase